MIVSSQSFRCSLRFLGLTVSLRYYMHPSSPIPSDAQTRTGLTANCTQAIRRLNTHFLPGGPIWEAVNFYYRTMNKQEWYSSRQIIAAELHRRKEVTVGLFVGMVDDAQPEDGGPDTLYRSRMLQSWNTVRCIPFQCTILLA